MGTAINIILESVEEKNSNREFWKLPRISFKKINKNIKWGSEK